MGTDLRDFEALMREQSKLDLDLWCNAEWVTIMVLGLAQYFLQQMIEKSSVHAEIAHVIRSDSGVLNGFRLATATTLIGYERNITDDLTVRSSISLWKAIRPAEGEGRVDADIRDINHDELHSFGLYPIDQAVLTQEFGERAYTHTPIHNHKSRIEAVARVLLPATLVLGVDLPQELMLLKP